MNNISSISPLKQNNPTLTTTSNEITPINTQLIQQKQMHYRRQPVFDIINQSQRHSRNNHSPLHFPSSNLTFDSAYKANMVQYLSEEQKGQNAMKFLKKHLSDCTFFQNYALPVGDDVFELCIHKIKIAYSTPYQIILQRGEQVNKLIILLSGSLIKSKQIQKKSEEQPQHQQQQQYLTPEQFQQINILDYLKQNDKSMQSNEQTPSSKTSLQDNQIIYPINSVLDTQFIKQTESQYYIQSSNEDCIYGYITYDDFQDCIKNSKNRELIESLNGLRYSYFFSDWPILKLKPIIAQSTILSFERNSFVYKQNQSSLFWYVILEGEFEYTKEITIENEINEIMKACLDPLSHEFKKQSIITDENQKGKQTIRLSILQKGEIFGIEDIIPKQDRQYNVRCISCSGQVRQINESCLNKIIAKNNSEEKKKIIHLAESKNQWLNKAISDKMDVNMNMHKTILNCKRNRAIENIKSKEFIKYQGNINSNINPGNVSDCNINNNNFQNEGNRQKYHLRFNSQMSSKELKQQYQQQQNERSQVSYHSRFSKSVDQQQVQSLSNIGQKYTFNYKTSKSPINYIQPDKNPSFIKREIIQDDDINAQMNQQLILEKKSMKKAKDDLLTQYRVTIDKYFSEQNQKFYQKQEEKKQGVDKYLKGRKWQNEDLQYKGRSASDNAKFNNHDHIINNNQNTTNNNNNNSKNIANDDNISGETTVRSPRKLNQISLSIIQQQKQQRLNELTSTSPLNRTNTINNSKQFKQYPILFNNNEQIKRNYGRQLNKEYISKILAQKQQQQQQQYQSPQNNNKLLQLNQLNPLDNSDNLRSTFNSSRINKVNQDNEQHQSEIEQIEQNSPLLGLHSFKQIQRSYTNLKQSKKNQSMPFTNNNNINNTNCNTPTQLSGHKTFLEKYLLNTTSTSHFNNTTTNTFKKDNPKLAFILNNNNNTRTHFSSPNSKLMTYHHIRNGSTNNNNINNLNDQQQSGLIDQTSLLSPINIHNSHFQNKSPQSKSVYSKN